MIKVGLPLNSAEEQTCGKAINEFSLKNVNADLQEYFNDPKWWLKSPNE